MTTYLEYLVKTATPGGTMSRQGPDVALGRLAPSFAEKLAAAIKAARAEGINASVYSAYRPPGYGVGGYADKYNSLHSYGLATDIAGIGRPGSDTAKRWYEIATNAGLYNPYGPENPKEFNHFQAVPEKGRQYVEAHPELRASITASGPPDVNAMWAAAGIPMTPAPDPFGVMAYNARHDEAAPKPAPTGQLPPWLAAISKIAGFIPPPGLPVPAAYAAGAMGAGGQGSPPPSNPARPSFANLLAQATAAAQNGTPWQSMFRQPGAQGGGIVAGPSGYYSYDKKQNTYTDLRTGRVHPLNPR